MLSFKRIDNLDELDWPTLDAFSDRTVCQTREWLSFITECQAAEPVVASISDGTGVIGWYTGMITRKLGFRILGSPFPGWTTYYMGFNLPPDGPRLDAVAALAPFAFRELGCMHLELMDRGIPVEDAQRLGWPYRVSATREINLGQSEDDIWKQMSNSSARYCVRKAARAGVVVEEVPVGDTDFAGEYYEQLQDVFAKQSLVPTYGIERVESLIRHMHPIGRLLLLRARDAEGTCLATGLFPGHGTMAYFWGGASLRVHQKLSPNEALIWHAIRYWRNRGALRFNLGGGGSYKRKYGGSEIDVPWLRKSKYAILESGREAARSLVDSLQHLRGRSRH